MYTPSQQVNDQIVNNFTYHSVQGNQQERYERLRNAAREFAMLIATNTPTSREQSVALTKLEETMMWTNAAIARNEEWDGGVLMTNSIPERA
jgi:hypothetical protein